MCGECVAVDEGFPSIDHPLEEREAYRRFTLGIAIALAAEFLIGTSSSTLWSS